ncbi:MAG TPA: dihydrolipoamide acetyltransferase family protein [Thermoleophilaceae bacterium]|nr:dihydrolipoamide acetyltransferase family protein [Thermoleophilaceae bacterium]
MASEVVMPRLSDSMEEGTILKWLVSVGDEVKRGQGLVEIETDKANMTYEADTDGTLIEVVAEEGDTLPVGELIARIGAPDEAEAKADGAAKAEGEAEREEQPEPEQREEAEPEPEPAGSPTATEEQAPERTGDGRIKASPVARRMARDLGVELGALEGSGPGGRIVKADVEAAAKEDGRREEVPVAEPEPEERPPEPARAPAEAGAKGQAEVVELSRLQQTVSRRMAESKATAPDFALSLDVDMSRCVELRQRLKEVAEPAPSINDMIVKAAAMALREYPRVNGAYRDGKWELYPNVNVGVAVAAEAALVVPTIFDTDKKSLGEISRQARALIEKVRERKITPPEVAGGTFTVSNLGMYGIEHFTAVINPPQAGLLTVGALMKKPVVDQESGRIVARDSLTLTLVCDHRILYGAEGAQFLSRVRELLEQPLALAL